MSDQIENNESQTTEAASGAPAHEYEAGRKITARQGIVNWVENLFKFRKSKDKDTGVETERANILVSVPVPSVAGIVDILENGDSRPKELDLLMYAVSQVVIDRVKDALAEDPTLTAENLDLSKYTFAAIANEPESERGGRGLDKELVAAFVVDYVEVMPAATGKDVKQVEKQAAIMQQRFTPIRNHAQKAQIIDGFRKSLDVYVNATQNLDDFASVVSYLQNRLDTLAKAEVSMTDALGF